MSALSSMQSKFSNSGLGRWFYSREPNERPIIVGIAALIIVSLLWLLIWKPVSDWRTLEANRHQNAQQLLDWLKANEAEARRSSRNPTANRGGRALIPVITKAAQAHSISVNRLQPESNGVISVVLEQQSFNKIISWVSQLNENNGVSVDRASFDGQESPGYVNAQLRLN